MRTATLLLMAVYIIALIVIDLGRRQLLPAAIAPLVPRNHYAAINIAFTFLLYLEVIDLVYGLASSVSRAVGKQFEIFSLILLRCSFKKFAERPEPQQFLPDRLPQFPACPGHRAAAPGPRRSG